MLLFLNRFKFHYFRQKDLKVDFKKFIAPALLATSLAMSGVAGATPSLSFIIDGDTYGQPYSISNISTGGETVIRFSLDLGTIPSGGPFCFDTLSGGACNPGQQAPWAFSPVNAPTVGLTSPSSVADGSSLIDLFFNDFGVGETFSWNIDVDSASAVSVYGNNLIGASAFVDFSNGQRLLGTLQAVAGNSDASAFTVTGIVRTSDVPEPISIALVSLGLLGLGVSRRKSMKID